MFAERFLHVVDMLSTSTQSISLNDHSCPVTWEPLSSLLCKWKDVNVLNDYLSSHHRAEDGPLAHLSRSLLF